MFQDPPLADPINWAETIKNVSAIATLIISITNLILTITLFVLKNKREDSEAERKLKLEWFNKFILDYNLSYFHDFFEKSAVELDNLKTSELSDEVKSKILENVKGYQREFRIHFVDSLLAVDRNLYDKMIHISDKLIDDFTNTAFDPGIKLSHEPKFEEEITIKLTSGKTQMIQELFKFDGSIKTQTLPKQLQSKPD